jgi:hypothetical protein
LLRNRGSIILQYNDIQGDLFVSNNVFINNTLTNVNTAGIIQFSQKLVVSYNQFNNPDVLYDVRVLNAAGNPSPDLSYNWWGSSSEEYVIKVIHI